MKDREHSSTIYTVDVLDTGVFGDSGEVKVTATNKRDYWNNVLLPEVKCLDAEYYLFGPVLIPRLSA